ncbi:MAG: hypothetical protein ACKVPJ_05675, partial [Chitinophagales bacterium]
MKRLIVLIGYIITLSSYAQVTEDWVSPDSYYGKNGIMVAVDASDNVFTLSDIFNGDIYLTKRAADGTILWSTGYDNTTSSQWEVASWVCIDGNGDAIVTGFTNTGFGSEWYPVQMVTMKFNGSDGVLEWRVTESTGSAHRGRVCAVDAENNIYVSGDMNAFRTSYSDTGNQVLIKYAPDGTQIWKATTDEEGNSMPGPSVAMKFDSEGNIIIIGSPPFSYSQTTVKFSPDGICLWHVSFDGYGGPDIAIDASDNIYILGSMYVTDIDIVVRKVDSDGALLWENTYDFGSANLSRRIVCDSEGNAIICGYGSQLTGMPYVDWLVFKINSSGTELWEHRYNEHANNDEWPLDIKIDNADNVYIIGQGGPWPGYFWTSLTQMVTVKYNPDGTNEWVALHTTYASVGQSLCLASDNSIYAVGQGNAVTIHYTQETPPVCDTPTDLFANNITINKARLNWTLVPGAFQYEVWYKKSTASAWKKKIVPATSNKLNIKNLLCNTNYVWQIRTICD